VAQVTVDLQYNIGTSIPSVLEVLDGEPALESTGLVLARTDVYDIEFVDSVANTSITIDILKLDSGSSYFTLKFRYIDDDNYWWVAWNITNGAFSLKKAVNGNISTLLALDTSSSVDWQEVVRVNIEADSTSVSVATANAEDALVTLYSENDSDNNTGNKSFIYAGLGGYTLKSVSFTNSDVSTLNPIASVMVSGFKRVATKHGKIFDLHSQINTADSTEEYWLRTYNTENWPNWPSEQYPIVKHSSTDHALNGGGGIYKRVYEEGIGQDPKDPTGWHEWQDISSRPEFDHIVTKTNPIFFDTSQTETPTLIIKDGIYHLYYHDGSVNSPAYGPAMQNTKYVTSSNPVDFLSSPVIALTHNPTFVEGRSGHMGYFQAGTNLYRKYQQFSYIGKSLHGGPTSQIHGGNNAKNWDPITISNNESGLISEFPEFGEGKIFTLAFIDEPKFEGAYYRVRGSFRTQAGGGANDYSQFAEFLIDENLGIVSRPLLYLPVGSSGEWDATQISSAAEVTYKGVTYCFYNALQSDGYTGIGVATITEEPHDWEVFAPNSNENEVVNVSTALGGTAGGVTYSETPFSYQSTYPTVNYTALSAPVDTSPVSFITNDSVTLADHDFIDVKFNKFGKGTSLPLNLEFGLVNALTGEASKLSFVLPAGNGDANQGEESLRLTTLGCYNDNPRNVAKKFGQGSNFFKDNESPKAKHEIGFRIIPSLDKLIVLEGNASTTVRSIAGFDYSIPLKAFARASFANTQVEGDLSDIGEIAFHEISITTYSANAVAVPNSPNLTSAKTADSITLTASNVAGATGYKYYLDGVEQDNGNFTGLEPETDYTVYARASNALGDSAPSTISAVRTTDAAPVNTAPTANAGQDQSVAAGAQVTVTGIGTVTTAGATIVGHSWDDGAGNVLETTATYTFTAPTESTAQAIVLNYVATDSNEMSSTPDTVTINVAAYVPPVSTPGDVLNLLELKATLYSGTQEKPFLNSSAGALFKGRDARITIEVDDGNTDVSTFEESVFQLFTLAGSDPLISKSTENGISYVDNKVEVLITAAELGFSGRHYFEAVVVKNTQANLLSGYITIVNSRIH
tara:strand:- start:75517 stop:78765 length:3249 start_codon:yes stop_codon:yes gene_type:complete